MTHFDGGAGRAVCHGRRVRPETLTCSVWDFFQAEDGCGKCAMSNSMDKAVRDLNGGKGPVRDHVGQERRPRGWPLDYLAR